MALSFTTPIKALASVGFGAGDIAVLVGAGRAVGNWVKAKYIDQALLQIADVKEFMPRRDLVNSAELNERWSKELIVFQDGRILPLQRQETENILKGRNYDGFTWFMAVLTAALTAATTEHCKRWILLAILSERCDHDEGKEYLLHDIDRNIEAWQSIGTTRKMTNAARRCWARLEHEHMHQPGLVPFADRQELKRFILWLTGAGEEGEHSKEFRTASSDIVSVALVLHDLGLSQIQIARSVDEVMESQLAVILDLSKIAYGPTETRPKRRGLCISMTNLQEVISLWPGTAMANNRRREVFMTAYRSVTDVSVIAAQLVSGQIQSREEFEPLYAFEFVQQDRLPEKIGQFCIDYLVAPSNRSGAALNEIVASWKLNESASMQIIDSALRMNPEEFGEHLAELQIFILGYYYGLLRPLIDTSRMSVIQAFASWTWNDLEIFQILRSGRKLHGDPTMPNNDEDRPMAVAYIERHFILKVAAYLFAGVDMDQVRNMRRGCCGVKGKLILLDRMLMGDTDSLVKLCEFSLLDIDDTCLPSNSRGLLLSGGRDAAPPTFLSGLEPRKLQEIVLPTREPDFTSLIEPDWENDLNASLVTYRRHGRVIHRCDPESIFNAVFGASIVTNVYYGDEGQFRRAKRITEGSEMATDDDLTALPISLDHFYGGILPLSIMSNELDPRLCVATNNLPKIRCCVTSIYNIDLIDTMYLANLRGRPDGGSDQALIVNLESCQVIIK